MLSSGTLKISVCFFEREKALLEIAKASMPRLPFKEVDLLIIDEIGKNISGSGMDTNVIGRKFRDHYPTTADEVACKRIFVRGLTEETHGNACGIGLAEFTNQRTIDAVDLNITRINALTGGHPSVASLPVALETDREVVDIALETVGLTPPPESRVIHIADTLRVSESLVSEAYLSEIESRDDLEILEGPQEMQFDSDGNLLPVLGAAAAHHA